MAVPGEERLRMGFEMFDAARSIILAGCRREPETPPGITLLLRFYGGDFDPKTLSAIIERIRL